MRAGLMPILLLIGNFIIAQNINTVRDLYLKAGENREQTSSFLNVFDGKTLDNIIVAYNGTALTMYADVVKGKFSKLKYFLEGKELLEQAIGAENTNVEMRFLRFSIQTNIPAILAYNNINEDKNFILSHLQQIDTIGHEQVQKVIYKLLLNSDELNKEEKQMVLKHLKSK